MSEDRLSAIVDALEVFWLRYEAAMILLDKAKIPNYRELVTAYAEKEANKTRARARFAEADALLRRCQIDSGALTALSQALQNLTSKQLH